MHHTLRPLVAPSTARAQSHEAIFANPSRFGSTSDTGAKEAEVVIWRAPTMMTPKEREFSRQCTDAFPPSTKKRSFHAIPAPQMLRCPVGGGTCFLSIINVKNPRGSANSHFSIHHRNGAQYSTKVEGSRNNFLYTSFPGSALTSDMQS